MNKILILGYPFEYYKGGAEYQYMLLESYLSQQYEVKYLFPHPEKVNNPHYITYQPIGYKYISHLFYPDIFTIYNLIKQYSPQTIYRRGVDYLSGVGTYYASKNNCRMILHIASILDLTWPGNENSVKNTMINFIKKKLKKYAIRNADEIACQAQYQVKLLHDKYGRNNSKVINNFHPVPNKTSIKSKTLKIVWVGNYKPLKQPELFIKLAEELKEENAEFIMVGRYPQRNNGDQIKYSCEANTNLKSLGEINLEEVENILAGAHILVNTSLYEGFPNTFIQAWLREVVVVSLNADPDDILVKEGIGFHSGNFEQSVNDVRLLIRDEELRNCLAAKSKIYALENFNMDININKLLSLIIRDDKKLISSVH